MARKSQPKPFDHRGVRVTIGTDGRYHAKVTVKKRADGTYDRRHVGSPVSDPEAIRAKIDKLLDAVASKTVRKPGMTITVQEWFTLWLTEIAPQGRRALRERSLDDYWSKLRTWVFPAIGNLTLDDLEPDDLDAIYNAIRAAGRAESTALKVHAIIHRGLRVAMRRGRIHYNVADRANPPEHGEPNRTPLQRAHARRVVEVIRGRRNAARFLTGLIIGPRQGEALGLTREYLYLDDREDGDGGDVEIAWQLQRLKWRHGCDDPHACGAKHHRLGKCETDKDGLCLRHRVRADDGPRAPVKGCPPACHPTRCDKHAQMCPKRIGGGLQLRRPKTWRPNKPGRVVSLPPQLVRMLRAHLADQAKERLRAGNLWRQMTFPDGEDANLVFTQLDGAPIDPRQDWQEWQDILQEAGVPAARVHAMRHTAGSMMSALGISIEVIQEVLGHADIRQTRGYVRVESDATRAATSALSDALFGGGGGRVTGSVTGRGRRRSS